MVITRIIIISIRHGTSSVGNWLSNSQGLIGWSNYRERLISQSWVIMHPDVCMHEVEKEMVKIGATDKFYVFKPLTPIYPTMV